MTGTGFAAARSVLLVDQVPGGPSEAEAAGVSVRGSRLTFTAPPAAVGRDDVLVCSATACSTADPSVDTFRYVSPVDPVLTSASRTRGPSTGGTVVRLSGTGLGWVVAVRFGRNRAATFANGKGTDDGGSPTVITVTAPPGRVGATVPVQVETLASQIDGHGWSPVDGDVTFTYSRARA